MVATPEDKARMIDKVRKLLRLSKSSNEHEAALAAQRAQEILSKYNLTLTEEEVKGEHANVLSQDTNHQFTRWMVNLAWAVGESFDCNWFKDRRHHISFVGVGADSEIAMYTFMYLMEEIYRLAGEFNEGKLISQGQKRIRRESFSIGAVATIREKLKKQTVVSPTNTTALMVIKKAIVENTYKTFAVRTVRTAKRRNFSSAAYIAGKEAGKHITINKGIANR